MTFAEFLVGQKFPLSLKFRVTPGAPRTEIIEQMADGQTWKMRVAAPPKKGKANQQIRIYFHKNFALQAEVTAGASGRMKLVKLEKI